MNLAQALKLLSPAVGDGKVIAAHAFVLHRDGLLHATDGRQWASVPLDPFETAGTPNFCVRYDALAKAVAREGSSVALDSDNVIVRYRPRGRIVLRPLAIDDWPMIEPAPEVDLIEVSGLKSILSTLVKFAGGGDMPIWSQAVHLTPDFAMGVSQRGGAKYPTSWNIPHNFTLPLWAVQFILGQDEDPEAMWEEEGYLGFRWANGLVLRSRMLSEDAPEPVMTLMSNLPHNIGEAVPEGLREAVKRLKEHGAVNFRMGDGRAWYHTESVDVDEEVDVPGRERLWNTDVMLTALNVAEWLDLSGDHGKWIGNGYIGIFTGMQ
jgi:hypothetical protein